ncbi:MAG: hypothetical protein ACI4MZ_04750 [Christensenellales bacterium]
MKKMFAPGPEAIDYKVTPGLDTVLKWFMFTATILGVSVLTSKFQVYGNIPFNIVLGIIVLFAMKPVFFETLKLSTLLVGRVLCIFACFALIPGPIFVIVVLGLYIINILEATMTDFFKNKQYYNGVSGIFVAIGASAFFLGSTWGTTTTPYSPIYFIDGFSNLGTEVAFTSEYFTNQASVFNGAVTGTTSVGIGITIAMIIAYTIWNWLFVTGEFSSSVALMHVGFLLAPILGVFIGPLVGMGRFGMAPDPGLWLLFRASTLTFGGILQIGGKNWFENNFYFEKFDKFVKYVKNSKPIQITCMVVCCSLMIFAVVAGFVPAR